MVIQVRDTVHLSETPNLSVTNPKMSGKKALETALTSSRASYSSTVSMFLQLLLKSSLSLSYSCPTLQFVA